MHHNEEREKWEIDKKKHHRKNKTDDKASGTPAGVTNDHNDDDIGIVIDDDQRKIERASATYSEQQKELHLKQELVKCEIVTKNRHRKNTMDDKANESRPMRRIRTKITTATTELM